MKLRKISRVGRSGRVGGLAAVKPVKLEGGVTGGGIRQLNVLPPALREMARRIGNRRARDVWGLMRKGVVGSLPELCTYHWLERRKLTFEFQSHQMGGRRRSGGAVLDFLISGLTAGGWYVWRVQGEYWHQGDAVERKDEIQKIRLARLKIGGVPVVAVVDLWENDVYDRSPEVFELAEIGVGLRDRG